MALLEAADRMRRTKWCGGRLPARGYPFNPHLVSRARFDLTPEYRHHCRVSPL